MSTLIQSLFWTAAPRDTPRPVPPEKPRLPLLMGDILTQRGGEPELLIQWRAAQARKGE